MGKAKRKGSKSRRKISQAGIWALPDGQPVKLKKEDEQELPEEKAKVDVQDERKAEVASSHPHQQQQASVIQQRSNMYMQPLYYNQYYVPPYGYPDQVYHNHLMNTNPTYRQQYEERQRLMASSTGQGNLTEEDWKQKGPVPPGLTKAPSLSDLGKPQATGKQRDTSSEPVKSVIIPKGEEVKLQPQQAEGLKMKLSEAGHHGKDDSKASVESARLGMEQAMWYRQCGANM
ncbi:zinc finger protein [Pimephales promelas]|nr:zinc finger protein [Pimephales promelas]